jgi:hypothetical protein
MAYIIDRRRALFSDDIVAIVSVRQRRVRSLAILKDKSLCHSLTRTRTLMRCMGKHPPAIVTIGSRRSRTTRRRGAGVIWLKEH